MSCSSNYLDGNQETTPIALTRLLALKWGVPLDEKPSTLRSMVVAIVLATGIVLTLGPLRQRFNSSLQIGSDAPPLTWKDRAGHSVSLANLKGKVVLLHFWANWCVPCLAEMPSLAELDARIANADFSIWAFHVDRVRADNLKNLPLETYPKNIIVDFDRSQLSALDVSAIPVSYLVDREGKIRRVFRGAQNWRSEGLVQLIRSLGKDS